MERKTQSKSYAQLIWGVALILMGVAVFFRIPQVMPKLAEMGQSGATLTFIRVCFYIMGFILVGGGLKKVIAYQKSEAKADPDASTTDDDV